MNNRGKEGEPVRRIRSIPGFIDALDTRKAFHDSPSIVERVRRFVKPPKKETFPPEDWESSNR